MASLCRSAPEADFTILGLLILRAPCACEPCSREVRSVAEAQDVLLRPSMSARESALRPDFAAYKRLATVSRIVWMSGVG